MRNRSDAIRPTEVLAEKMKVASAPLAAELAKPPPPLFVSANKGPTVTADFERIVETLYAVDAAKEYEDLEKNLEVGEERGDFRTLQQHLDKAEARARRAHKLFIGAKLERERWELDAEATFAAMRTAAIDDLEGAKAAGRKKMITDADVRSKMAELFRDEWKHQELKRVKLKGMVDSIEHLVGRWDSKCRSLQTLLQTLRK
jgi:hypothetical protein